MRSAGHARERKRDGAPVRCAPWLGTRLLLLGLLAMTSGGLGHPGLVVRVRMHVCNMQEAAMELAGHGGESRIVGRGPRYGERLLGGRSEGEGRTGQNGEWFDHGECGETIDARSSQMKDASVPPKLGKLQGGALLLKRTCVNVHCRKSLCSLGRISARFERSKSRPSGRNSHIGRQPHTSARNVPNKSDIARTRVRGRPQ